METKPKRFTVHGIFGKALMETAKDVFTGNLSSTVQDSVKEKIENRLNNDDDLQSFIADTVVKQIKNITANSSPSKPQPLVVKKVLNKIYKNNEFRKVVVAKLDLANTLKDDMLSKLKIQLEEMIYTIQTKYLKQLNDELPQILDKIKNQCLELINTKLQNQIEDIKSKYFSVEEPLQKKLPNDDITTKFGRKNYSDKILNPSTGRYVKRNGKIGQQLLKGNVPKKIKKNTKNSKESKRIKNKKNSRKTKKTKK